MMRECQGAAVIDRARRVHIMAERGHCIVDRGGVVLPQRLKQGDDIVVEVVAAAIRMVGMGIVG
jgi:hypothetical protein